MPRSSSRQTASVESACPSLDLSRSPGRSIVCDARCTRHSLPLISLPSAPEMPCLLPLTGVTHWCYTLNCPCGATDDNTENAKCKYLLALVRWENSGKGQKR